MKHNDTSGVLEFHPGLEASASPAIVDDDVKITVIPHANCPVCGEAGAALHAGLTDWLFCAPGSWNLRTCAKCGIAWLDPQPVPQDIPKLYESYYTHNAAQSHTSFKNLRQEILHCVLAQLGYRVECSNRFLPRLLARIPPIWRANALDVMALRASEVGSLLDVGCGNGAFIAHMQSLGWDVSGVDPDPAAVAQGHAQGLHIFQGAITDVPPDNQYEVITLSHVIEHVADPTDLLRECGRRLRPGSGRLVITTPNIESLGHRWFGRYWRGLEVPRHLNLFSMSSLDRCVSRAGLRRQTLRTETRLAVRIHNASVCARQGERNVSVRTRFKASTKIAGYFFMALENLLIYPNPRLGEELFCVCAAPEEV